MIIVGQIKNCITDDLNIYINRYKSENELMYTIENKEFKLAEYKTKERAKEVLEEIIRIYQANKLIECCKDIATQNQMTENFLKNGMIPFKYEMPKE